MVSLVKRKHMFLSKLFANKQTLNLIKKIKWLGWAQKVLAKRGIETDIDSCAYEKQHLVSNVKPIGGGWMFYSKACSGCAISKIGLNMKKLPKGAPNCALLKFPLLTREKPEEGTIFKLSTLPQSPE